MKLPDKFPLPPTKKLLQPIRCGFRQKFIQRDSLSAHQQFALRFEVSGEIFPVSRRSPQAGELMRGSFCEGEIGETAVGRQLPALHGDGLVKLQGGADELFHLAIITSQFAFELAVG